MLAKVVADGLGSFHSIPVCSASFCFVPIMSRVEGSLMRVAMGSVVTSVDDATAAALRYVPKYLCME